MAHSREAISPLQPLDFLLFPRAVGFQLRRQAAAERGGDVGRGGALGPGEHLVERAVLEADGGVAEQGGHAGASGGEEAGGAVEVQGQVQGGGVLPERGEAGGVAGEGGVEVLLDLQAERRSLADQVAAVAGEQLQLAPARVPLRFQQGEAVDGGAVDGVQVGVVGLDAGVGGLAELLGGEGVDGAGLEAGGGEGALHGVVVSAGAFDGDDHVAEPV